MGQELRLRVSLLSRTMKGLRLYPPFKLASKHDTVMDAVKRHRTPASETKDFITHRISAGRQAPQDPLTTQ